MKSVVKWLSTPYYFNPSSWFKLKTSLILGLSSFLFLYIFRPFSISSLEEKIIFEYTFGISFVSFLGAFCILIVPPLVFKDFFHEEKWTVGKNLLLIFLGLLFIGTFLWFFANTYRAKNNSESINYLVFLTYTYISGAIPISFMIFINEKNVRLRREKKAEFISEINVLKPKQLFNKNIIIYADNQKEFLNISIDNLVYVTSQGNYASFFTLKNNYLKEQILRVTLSKVSDELSQYSNMIRCHKSFIINTKFIKKISGNARGYLLHVDCIPFQIPVSRSFGKESLKKLI